MLKNYKVLVEFELEGVPQEEGSQVELSEEIAVPLFDEGKIELAEAAGGDGGSDVSAAE